MDSDGPAAGRRVPSWAGPATIVGALIWTVIPWVQLATYGTRPYVGTPSDVGVLAGLLLVGSGLLSSRRVLGDTAGRLGRVAVGATAVGLGFLSLLALRAVWAVVEAGVRPVPATGEDPAGLVLTWLALLGYALALGGTGLVGVSLRRRSQPPRVTVVLCLLAPVVPVVVLVAGSVLPLAVRMAVVRTPVLFVPLGVAWVTLGTFVRRPPTD